MSVHLRILSAEGEPIGFVANFSAPISGGGAALEYALSVGNPQSALILTLPPPPLTDPALFAIDTRIEVWRSVAGQMQLDGGAVWLVRRRRTSHDALRITALHANHLLTRRIIAYDAGSSYTSKSADQADDLIKAFARENLGASVSAANRDSTTAADQAQTDISTYLTIPADVGAAASVAKAATRRRLDEVVHELGEASTTAGTYLTAEIVSPGDGTLTLQTYTTQRGTDHRYGTADPVIFSAARGNIENVALDEDWTEEVTVAIAGGQGEEAARLIRVAADTTRLAASPFNRIERFVDMSNVSDATQLQDEADAALRAGRPRVTLEGDLVETDGCTRGLHFDLGDMVTVLEGGLLYDVRLDMLRISYAGGALRTRATMRGTL